MAQPDPPGFAPADLGSGDPAHRFRELVDQIRDRVQFETYLVTGTPRADRGAGIRVFADNWPADCRASYFDDDWHDHDALFTALRVAHRAVTVDTVRALAAADAIMARRWTESTATLGEAVVAVPIRYSGRLSGAVVIHRRRPEFSAADVEYLELVAPAIHLRATELPAAAPQDLTARERECLNWTSVGKTAWEIGSILGISEHTAVAHLNAAVRKLHASSRAHAVAEALRRGLIA